eukprot:s735_g12.t1
MSIRGLIFGTFIWRQPRSKPFPRTFTAMTTGAQQTRGCPRMPMRMRDGPCEGPPFPAFEKYKVLCGGFAVQVHCGAQEPAKEAIGDDQAAGVQDVEVAKQDRVREDPPTA